MKEPRGIRNNNPLNIRKGNNWKGERYPQNDPSFEQFISMEMGLRAGFILLRNYQKKTLPANRRANSIRKIIARWAPTCENNTVAYINTVSKRTGILPDELIEFSDRRKMVALVEAMCFVECGVSIDIRIIESAYDLVA